MAYPQIWGGLGSPQSIHTCSSVQHHQIGETGYCSGGRIFKYGRYVGAGETRGHLMVSAAMQTTLHHELLATTTTSMIVGQRQVTGITIGATALTQDMYQWLSVDLGVNKGTVYRISGHAAFDASATTVSVQLEDPIVVASDADTVVSLIRDPYADFVLATQDWLDVPAGIPQVTMAAGTTTPQYVWLQTWGPATAIVDGTSTEGVLLFADSTTAGELLAFTLPAPGSGGAGANLPLFSLIGVTMGIDNSASEPRAVFLKISA